MRLKAFENLYQEYYNQIYGFLYRMCADAGIAEDLTQETFLQAYTSFHRFRGECEVFTWLAAIAKHTYFKYLKKNKLHLDAANLELVIDSYCGMTPEHQDSNPSTYMVAQIHVKIKFNCI